MSALWLDGNNETENRARSAEQARYESEDARCETWR